MEIIARPHVVFACIVTLSGKRRNMAHVPPYWHIPAYLQQIALIAREKTWFKKVENEGGQTSCLHSPFSSTPWHLQTVTYWATLPSVGFSLILYPFRDPISGPNRRYKCLHSACISSYVKRKISKWNAALLSCLIGMVERLRRRDVAGPIRVLPSTGQLNSSAWTKMKKSITGQVMCLHVILADTEH
jgi:hypothetical protein